MRLVTPRNILKVVHILAIVLITWSVILVFHYLSRFFYDRRLSRSYQELLCDAYWNHDIAGKLCVNLCDAKRPLYLASYTVHRHGHRLYWWNATVAIRVPGSAFEQDFASSPAVAMRRLPAGTTAGQFRSSVTRLLREQLGVTDDAQLLYYLLQVADADGSGKVSLGEAESLWTLLHSSDFLLRALLRADVRVPSLVSHCGPVYAVQRPGRPASRATWLAGDDWPTRVAVTLSVVEMLAELHAAGGGLHLCSLDVGDVTLTGPPTAVTAFLTDLTAVCTRRRLDVMLAGRRACATHADCAVARHCAGRCRAGACIASGHLTSVAVLCRAFTPYLLDGEPLATRRAIRPTLERCAQLDLTATDDDTSLMYSELRVLLWKLITAAYR